MNGEKGQVSASPPPRQSGRKRQKTSNQDEPALVHRSNTKSRSVSNDQSRSASPFVKKQNQSIAFTNDTEIQQQAEEGDEDSDATADQVTTLIQTDDNHLPSNSNPNPRYGTRSSKGSNPPTPTVKNHLLSQRVSQSPTRSNSPKDRSNHKGNAPKMSRAGHSFTLEIDERESPRKKSGGKGKGKEKEKESNEEDAVLQGNGNGNGVEGEPQLNDEENQDGEEREKLETEQERKEREMEENLLQSWKEEFFEIVEQLPLELHRSFALMRELEQQMHGRLKAISDSSRSYREARGFSNPEPNQAETETNQPEGSTSNSTLQIPETSQPDSQEVITSSNPPSSSSSFQTAESSSQINNPPLPQVPSFKPSQSYSTRRSILKQIAESSNEAIRSAEEKVGLAATAYDWVDRHIRRLDSDLLKSENSLTIGLRPGTNESNNASNSNGLGKSSNGDFEMRNGNLEGLLNDADGEGGGGGENKKKRKRPIPKNKNRGSFGNDDRDDLSILPDMPIDPNEPRYCYCDQVSFGDMVACENDDCPREWFHYHCVDLASQPKGKWWCQFCAPKGWRGVGTAIPPGAPYVPAR